MNGLCKLLVITILCSAAGCGGGPKSAKGFTLPDGDAERGKDAFLSFHCYDCHSVSGVELPEAEEPDQVFRYVAIKYSKENSNFEFYS